MHAGGFFKWVEFANEPCVSRHGFSGVCLTSSECSLHGGVARGRCANGYGVCCQGTARYAACNTYTQRVAINCVIYYDVLAVYVGATQISDGTTEKLWNITIPEKCTEKMT